MVVGRPFSLATLVRSKPSASRLPLSLVPSALPRLGLGARAMSATAARPDPFRPAKRVAGQRQDVWYGA
jgi:kynurenine aminotransferase